jgi:hypothetical protein
VHKVTIDSPPSVMEPGEQVQLHATVTADPGLPSTVHWSSSALNVVTVSATGNAVAVANGEAVLTATSDADGTQRASATIRVEVFHAATQLSWSFLGPFPPRRRSSARLSISRRYRWHPITGGLGASARWDSAAVSRHLRRS